MAYEPPSSRANPPPRGSKKGRSSLGGKPATDPEAAARTRAAMRNDKQRTGRRLAVVYDINGPRVRLGLGWGLLVFVAAIVAKQFGLAIVYGAAAAIAALQVARAWQAKGETPEGYTAAGFAAALALSATVGIELTGVVLIALAVTSYGVASATTSGGSSAAIRAAGFTVQSAMFVGLAAASPVIAWRVDPGAALALVAMVSAYEIGDYLIGSGARNPFEGPTAGMAGIVVVTFIVGVFGVGSFDVQSAWRFALLASALAPVGQLVGSLVLPAANAKAAALRRLDSLIVLGPAFVIAYQIYIRGL